MPLTRSPFAHKEDVFGSETFLVAKNTRSQERKMRHVHPVKLLCENIEPNTLEKKVKPHPTVRITGGKNPIGLARSNHGTELYISIFTFH